MSLLDWQIASQWQAQLQWSYRDNIAITNDHNSLSLLNASVVFLPAAGHRWQLKVSNLLDKTYQVPVIQQIGSSNGIAINELPSRGQAVSLKYSWHF